MDGTIETVTATMDCWSHPLTTTEESMPTVYYLYVSDDEESSTVDC
jgi:hypothetical protein